MVYYNENKELIDITGSEFIGEGTQGKVYKLNDGQCVKIYGQNVSKYDPELFKFFRDANLEGYCKLYDLLYSSTNSSDIAGYRMRFYKQLKDNLLNMPTEYTLDSFDRLYRSISFLADNQILAKDTIPANSIMSNEGIVLIDYDASCKSNYDIATCQDVNTNNLLYLFRKLFEREIEKLGITIDDEIELYLDDLFKYSSNPTKALSRRLAYMRTPKEVLPFKYRY